MAFHVCLKTGLQRCEQFFAFLFFMALAFGISVFAFVFSPIRSPACSLW